VSKILKVKARQVFDSRGNPTVEAEVYTKNNSATAICPSGASTGTFEAYEKRDNKNKRYLGKSVFSAINLVNTKISKALKNKNIHDQERIDELLDMENKGKIKITGLHIHTGSDITKNNQFKEGIMKIFSIARDFRNIESIDLGGGIKIPYFKDDTSTNLNDYVKEVSKELKKFELEFNRKLKLIFEPGKFLVSDCGFFITRVNYIKSTKTKDFLQVDSGFNHLLRPTLYGSHHEIINLSNPAGRDKAGNPAKFTGTVKMSFKYIDTGSLVFSPILNAELGVEGVKIASTLVKLSSKSFFINCLTFWAFK